MVIATTIIPIASTFLVIGIIGIELASRASYTSAITALAVGLGEFIQGVEIFMLVSFEAVIITKVTMNSYCAWITTSHLLNDRFRWPILSVIGIITYIAAIMIDSYNQAFFYYAMLIRYVVFPFVALTLVLTLVLVMAGKKREKRTTAGG